MLTVHRDQEVKSMQKLRDANETSQRHRLSLLNKKCKKLDVTQGAHKTVFKTRVNKQHRYSI